MSSFCRRSADGGSSPKNTPKSAEITNNRFCHVSRSVGAFRVEIASDLPAFPYHLGDGGLDLRCRVLLADMPQQHRGCENERPGVGDSLPRNIRSAAMDCLKHGRLVT